MRIDFCVRNLWFVGSTGGRKENSVLQAEPPEYEGATRTGAEAIWADDE